MAATAQAQSALSPILDRKPRLNPESCWFDLRLTCSSIHRHGVEAAEFIPPRRRVIEYTGRLYNRAQTKKLYAERTEADILYIWEVPRRYWILDGRDNGSGAELINHSCDPNCYPQFSRRRLYYVSRRCIMPGEELTIDYNYDYDKAGNIKCLCGSAKCRGTINALEK